MSLLQKHDEQLFGKKFRNHIADTNKSKKQSKRFLYNTKSPFHLTLHTHREKVRDENFFRQKPDRKNSIMVTNNNNNNTNIILTTDRQGVRNGR